MNYEEIKDSLFMRLVPEWEKNSLKIKFASDICMVPAAKDGDIKEEQLAEWGVSLDCVKKDALDNMKSWEYEIVKYYKSHDGTVKLPVISTKDRKYGTCILLDDEAVEKIRKQIGTDFICLPSSKDELVAIRKGDDLDSIYVHTMIDLIMNQDPFSPKYLSTETFDYISEKGGLCVRNRQGEPVRLSEFL